jgi:hypothetical protein
MQVLTIEIYSREYRSSLRHKGVFILLVPLPDSCGLSK